MDDLETAILLIYDPSSSTSNPSLRSQAIAYADHIKSTATPSALLRTCLHLLRRSTAVPVHFWSLQTLHNSLSRHYSSLSPSADLPLLRSSLLSLPSSLPLSPPFVKNKLAQTLAFLIRIEYPSLFPSPFLELMQNASSAAEVDFFARLLAALDDDLLSQNYPRSAEEVAAAALVKDEMRVRCVSQIVSFCFSSVSGYRSSDPNLAAMVLETLRKYVCWIDIGLVANEAFLSLLFSLIREEGSLDCLQMAAAGCVHAIVLKGMLHKSKLALLQKLRMELSAVVADANTVLRVGNLITGYAAEALECWKRLGDGMELVEEVLPSVFYVMENSDEVNLGNVVAFLSDYFPSVKSSLSQTQVVNIGRILELVYTQIQYDSSYRRNLDVLDNVGKAEDDQMGEHRKELLTLFWALCRVAPDVTMLFIRNMLGNVSSSSEQNVEEVEAVLYLFYQLGETMSEETMKSGSGLLGELVPMLLSARFSCHSHRMVALMYLETITKYMKFVHENTQYIPSVLGAFLDERGIHHPNLNVGRRASYLFMKAVKLLKSKLVPFVDTILQFWVSHGGRNLQDTIVYYTSLDSSPKELKGSGSEDGSHTFEAIGLLIGMEDVSSEKQSEYLAALLIPLCQQVELLLMQAKEQGLEESSAKVVSFQQIIMALCALSKGFSERIVTTGRPAIGIMFKQTLDVLLQVLVAFPHIKPLRNKITSFLHRMVEILGGTVFTYLPMAFNQLLLDSEPKDMMDFLVLINQVICKFKTSVVTMIEDIFPTVASRLLSILSSDAFPSGPGYNTEEIRELQELQHTIYAFLHVMAMNNMSSVFLAPNCRVYLDAITQLLLLASCNHKDIIVRKMCVQIFVKLIKDWCAIDNIEEKVPGFRSFIIEKFASGCCFYSVLDKSFELREVNTLILFGEIVIAQKVMYEKFGNDFLVYFVSHTLATAQCPRDLAEQYYQKFQQGSDIKELKSFYQSLVEKLRLQQNRGLVFR